MSSSPSSNTHFSEVRVRFAPSPTGYLHVGGARSALFNYLFAKKNNGKFILRIEDTDQARSTEESLKMMLSDLSWLGLNWDEGPDAHTLKDKGGFAPYRQSERQNLYKKVAEKLISEGKAYYCFMTDEQIEIEREKLKAAGLQPHVDSPFENSPIEESIARIKSGEKAVVRFKTRSLRKDYILNDLIRGEVKFPSDMVGDFVLLRSDGMPVYNFCCVVDDHEMKISHVLRAEEHLPNTLRQLMIYEAMNWATPQFGHISLVLDEDRQKLSKRKGAVACDQFKLEGYLPSAMVNYLVLLGWSHPEQKEIMPLSEMEKEFSLERLNASGAIFDRVKLKWMNAQHLRALPNEEIYKLIKPFLDQANLNLPTEASWQMRSIEIFKPYMETLQDAAALYAPLDDSKYEILEESTETLSWESSKKVLIAWKNSVQDFNGDVISESDFLAIQEGIKNQTGQKGKNLFFPLRVALIGKPSGAELKILVPLMSKKSILQRAEKVLEKC